MSTHVAIIAALAHAAKGGQSVVLTTVVRVIGSSYGGVGARMVFHIDGSTVGLVSGGCLESDLCAHAAEAYASGRARVVTYDARADDDAIWGLGLGCNGLIDVLLQPLSPRQATATAELLSAASFADAPSVIATVSHADASREGPAVGAQALFTTGGTQAVGDWGDGSVLAAARARADLAPAVGRHGLVHAIGPAQVSFETVTPTIRLVICGSGPDAVPVARLARGLGWDVAVLDHRPVTTEHAARFHGARVIECAEPSALAGAVAFTRRTAAVVMSHHFARDTDYVAALLEAGIAYIGVLGPRPRTERMLAELALRGAESPAGSDDALFGPVGLDIGGDGPEAIALAIVAEVSAVLHERGSGHLRALAGELHGALP